MASDEIEKTSNPNWVWDEIVLVCDVVADNNWKDSNPPDPRVLELSELLQRLPFHSPAVRGRAFRSPSSVGHKMADIATSHRNYKGKPKKGGRLAGEVLQAFLDDPERMKSAAKLIRTGIESGTLLNLSPVEDFDDYEVSVPEGRLLLRRHLVRERNRKLRSQKVAQARKTHGEVACEVCGFDFERTYGPDGADYIECHHVVPLHASGETRTKLADLALLCANCHRMIHHRTPWRTPAELGKLVLKYAQQK
ncbi:hypothetical protein GCM10009527_035890 [Actinomadura nitritigenes]|uniref:HNH endonuclease n=1 Tax=Actinomadura nitritigenes TaxID=134602 RepID=A0ABS3QY68_9ACTN|nr:HNH endonuclease [Actinomadura nitritigenes]MBO2438934.1 HNH endonuclease [Actinomadura nitritigenes]HEU5026215.1 HNH endonuclease [Spirillospora sp.]